MLNKHIKFIISWVTAVALSVAFIYRQPAYSAFFGTGVPAGAMFPWWSTDTTVPTGWHLCDGSTVTWLTGPHAGTSVTLPNTIGTFIAGSDIQGGAATANSSGFGHLTNQSTGGSTTHTHNVTVASTAPTLFNGGSLVAVGLEGTYPSTSASSAPYYIGCPWIVKL